MTTSSPEAVVLAAGQGTRMKSSLPKVLHDLGGKPLLGHVLETVRSLGTSAIHVVYGHGGDAVQNALPADDLNWVHQAEQLGTGHAVQRAIPHVHSDGAVLMLYGDVPLVKRATLQRALDIAASGSLAVVTARLEDPTGYGRIVRSESGSVTAIREHKDASQEELAINEINSGIMAGPVPQVRTWLARLDNNNAQGELYLTDLVEAAVTDAVPVETVLVDDENEIAGVNDRVQLAELERAYQRERAEALMRAGVTLRDPARIDIRGEVDVAPDVTIDVNVILEGHVRIGAGTTIGANCVITDADIASGVTVLPNCVIEKATIGAGSRVGPFARVRPDAELGEDVHVGNFVEVKKSKLGRGAKVNHLSYVGDAEVGERVNVGAGTITCNYDGANKHKTTIGDDAFIGSGAMLVAPVTVGTGATIGAGSTINRDAPDGDLTVARVKQRSISGWKRPEKIKK